MRTSRRAHAPRWITPALLALIACAARQRPAAETVDPTLPPLLAALGDPETAAEFCGGPEGEATTASALVAALERDGVDLDAWRACLDERERPDAASGPLLRALVPAYLRAIDVGAAARVVMADAALWDRPPEWTLPADLVEVLRAGLARAPTRPDPAGLQAREDGRAALEMEAGRLDGAVVTREALHAGPLATQPQCLGRLARRLPDAELRLEARRTLVRWKVARDPALQVEGEALVDRVATTGRNAVTAPVTQATFTPQRDLIICQDIEHQRARVVTAAPQADASAGCRAPGARRGLPLADALRVSVEGHGSPLTVCADPRALDPTPCLAPELISVAPPARFDGRRRTIVLPDLPTGSLRPLLAGRRIDLGLTVAGQTIADGVRPVRFARPAPALFVATQGRGPDLDIAVGAEAGAPLLIEVTRAAAAPVLIAIEPEDLARYAIVSRGAPGADGLPGREGREGEPGSDGADIECGRRNSPLPGTAGQDGGTGGRGAPGGRGGDGGAVHARLSCAAASCDRLAASLRAALASVPGPGGKGGPGGPGGKGGPGGQYGHCVEPDRRNLLANAPAGRDGAPGKPGPDGNSGRAGVVEVVVTPIGRARP